MAILVIVAKGKVMAEERNYEENEMNFEGIYIYVHWTDLVHIWNERCPSLRDVVSQKKDYFCLAVFEVLYEGISLVPVKYTHVCRMLAA